MNKPAPKEPSMDEILSSIRQIIADDDAAGSAKAPAGLGAAPLVSPSPPIRPALMPRPAAAKPDPVPEPEPESEPEHDSAPLALSAAMIMAEPEDATPSRSMSFDELMGGARAEPAPEPFAGAAELVDPEDVSFEADPEPEPVPEADPMAMFSVAMDDELEEPPPPVAAARPAPRPQPTPAQAAPMPDPTLSSDMAEQLLDTTTQLAVKSTFSKLSGMSMVGSGVTIEAMMREMLRPMLKEWLDENLPSVVERMVEREIARISRGGE